LREVTVPLTGFLVDIGRGVAVGSLQLTTVQRTQKIIASRVQKEIG
jgi:hypothetical protein